MRKARPSLEQRRRIEELLAVLPMGSRPLSAEELRQLRAVIVLERLRTPETWQALKSVVKEPQSAIDAPGASGPGVPALMLHLGRREQHAEAAAVRAPASGRVPDAPR